jgi:hypothetical protein
LIFLTINAILSRQSAFPKTAGGEKNEKRKKAKFFSALLQDLLRSTLGGRVAFTFTIDAFHAFTLTERNSPLTSLGASDIRIP